MPALSTTRQNLALLVVLLAASLALMSGAAREVEGASFLESALLRASSPFVALAELVGGGLRAAVRGVHETIFYRVRNARLLREVAELRTEAVRLREAEQENARLRELLGMRAGLVPRSIAASVVTARLDAGTQVLVVDRGERDGVRPELPVVAWGGAVGRVLAVGGGFAKVRLLTDVDSGVAGVVQRSRVPGLVEGRAAEPPLELRYVPRFADVMHGDRVVTSGMDGIFPRGFGIGRVIEVEETADGGKLVRLEPELDYRGLEEVLIVLEPASTRPLLEAGAPAGDAP